MARAKKRLFRWLHPLAGLPRAGYAENQFGNAQAAARAQ
jgi:hypothetical protein